MSRIYVLRPSPLGQGLESSVTHTITIKVLGRLLLFYTPFSFFPPPPRPMLTRADLGFFNGGWLIPIGHQTLR